MYRVYGDIFSGNCYKIKLLLQLLNIEHEWIHVDILAGDTRNEAFATLNPNKKIPVLQINERESLCESNAILYFLAEGSAYMPTALLAKAKVLQWQFFEQYSHEPFIAVARYINRYLGLPDEKKEEYLAKQEGGHKALAVMEKQLTQSNFLVGDSPTIADISLYAYTHVAHEGGFSLETYPHIRQWLKRITQLPGYISMS